jgi:spore coat polysaccharide biosynthesis predicted glycosyltransferase SpsG
LALARALASWADCRLFLHGDAEAGGFVRRAGISWLPVKADMESSLAAFRAIDASALVVDSYAVSLSELETALNDVRLLVVVDDSGRFPLPAHLVVNTAIGLDPPEEADGTRYLLGPSFALLAPEFAEPPVRPLHADVRRVLLILGGATPAPLMAALARVVRRALPRTTLDIVLGPVGDGLGAMRAALTGLRGFRLHAAPEPIRTLMLEADLAVTAGGVTLLELAATGTPMVGICLAPNQHTNLTGFARENAALFAGFAEDPELPGAVGAALLPLAADAGRRRALGARARQLVDGLGSARIAGALRGLLVPASAAVKNSQC